MLKYICTNVFIIRVRCLRARSPMRYYIIEQTLVTIFKNGMEG